MRLDVLILITAAAAEVSAKTFTRTYIGPVDTSKKQDKEKRQLSAPEVAHLQLNSDALDHADAWEEVRVEVDQAAPNRLVTRGDGGKLKGCHGKKCANRFYRESEEEESTTKEHHEDEGFEEKYWVEHISSHKDDSHKHKSEVDYHDQYHRYNDTDDHYHHYPKSEGKKAKKVKVEAREVHLTEEIEPTKTAVAARPTKIVLTNKQKEHDRKLNKATYKELLHLCKQQKERKKKLHSVKYSFDNDPSEVRLEALCKKEIEQKEYIEITTCTQKKFKAAEKKYMKERPAGVLYPTPKKGDFVGTGFENLKELDDHYKKECAKELKIELRPTCRKHIASRSVEAGGDPECIKQRIYELKEKKTEEEKHTHKDDIEYFREEINYDDEESHNAGHHHDSYDHYYHKPQHHHHHAHPKKVVDPRKGKTEKKTSKKAKVEARHADADFHEGLTHEHVCTYFRGIAYKAQTLHRPVEQFQYENVPWLVHARGPWHHVLDGLRQIEWVLAKVARGLHETSGFTAREERELVGCYYAFAGINSPNGDNGQPFKKLLHLIADRSKMAKYEPYAQKRVHDVVRNLETAYMAANEQLVRVMRQDKYKNNILWDVKDKEGVRKYFAEVLRKYDVEKDRA